MTASRAAAFSEGLRAQSRDFLKNGFVLIRRDSRITTVSLESLNQLNRHITGYADHIIQTSLRYRFWRLFNSVDSSSNRHSIPLPSDVSPLLMPVLRASVSSISTFLHSLFAYPNLDSQVPLVELSALISYPNSKQQTVHSDIKYSSKETSHIISGFVALCPITVEKGPTYLYASTHTREFHDRRIRALRSHRVSYSSDGSTETDADIFSALDLNDGLLPSPCNDSDEVASRLPVYALLDTGDMLIFDTKLFHFGGANTSLSPRAVLCFAFQQGEEGKALGLVDGFTYHCHESVADLKATLESLEAIKEGQCR